MNKLINEFDEIIQWPKKPSVNKTVINWLSNKFNDIALLRRELISRKFLSRKDDGSEYWKTNK